MPLNDVMNALVTCTPVLTVLAEGTVPRRSDSETVYDPAGNESPAPSLVSVRGPAIVTTGFSRSQTNRAGRLSRVLSTFRAAPPRRSIVTVPEAAGRTSTTQARRSPVQCPVALFRLIRVAFDAEKSLRDRPTTSAEKTTLRLK